jgi:hypothetical protein
MRLYLRYHDGWNEGNLHRYAVGCDGFDQPGSYRRKKPKSAQKAVYDSLKNNDGKVVYGRRWFRDVDTTTVWYDVPGAYPPHSSDEAERMEGIEVWKSQSPSNHVIGFDTTHKYLSIQVTLEDYRSACKKLRALKDVPFTVWWHSHSVRPIHLCL